LEQDIDLDQVMDDLDIFIHDKNWCTCKSKTNPKFAVWSIHAVNEKTGERGQALKRSK